MKKRNFGLDVVRACAILFVLFAHIGPSLITDQYFAGYLYHLGGYGVELFFVLSGFLIGGILLKQWGPNFSFKRIKTFYIRRWLRTLPLYYLVLTILIVATNTAQNSFNLRAWHFLFIQNFNSQEMAFFPVSWSLSIEEWFYLLLPFLFLLLRKKSVKTLILTFIFIILASLIIRSIYVYIVHPSFDLGTRKFIPLRFDSLIVGVLLAIVKKYYDKIYKSVSHFGLSLVSIIFLVGYYVSFVNIFHKFGIVYFDSSFADRAFSSTLISLGIAPIIANAESNSFLNLSLPKNKIINYFFTLLSLYSYSLYLIHSEVLRLWHSHIELGSIRVNLMLSMIFVFFLSSVIFKFIEKPILRYRDKHF